MSDITIVTAFFDIGRGDWTPDKGLPHYLQRTTDTYFERFKHMATLDNDMVVFTSPDLKAKVEELRKGKPTTVITREFSSLAPDLWSKITEVQLSPEYQDMINPSQRKNPEYWNANYVLVNLLKSSFITLAIQGDFVKTDLVAWLDFGYCRDASTLNGVTHWKYPFSTDKIHFFNLKPYNGTMIMNIISNNDVHITGPHIVAHKDLWPKLEKMVLGHTDILLKNNLIDDDQTLLLMSSLDNPELFELHPVNPNDWFIVFKEYNESVS